MASSIDGISKGLGHEKVGAMKSAAAGAILTACLVVAGCSQIKSVTDTVSTQVARLFDGEPFYSKMSHGDVRLAAAAVQGTLEAAEDDAARGWSNRYSGNSGMVTPLKTYLTDAGMFCRDYRETIVIKDRAESYLNRACRDEGGVWHWID